MLNTILIAALIIAVAVVLMGIRVFFVKNGKFPDTHIGHNTELKRGVFRVPLLPMPNSAAARILPITCQTNKN